MSLRFEYDMSRLSRVAERAEQRFIKVAPMVILTNVAYTVTAVFGVLPKDNQLPGQVLACLDKAIALLGQGRVQAIAAIGGRGHGSHGQIEPEARMMKNYLVTKGVNPRFVITRDKPVTTPEALWEVRHLDAQHCRILTIAEKKKRIKLLADKIVGGHIDLTVETVRYALTPEERDANKYEGYLLQEARKILKDMRPGDLRAFGELYSFKYHLWESFVQQLRQEGRLKKF